MMSTPNTWPWYDLTVSNPTLGDRPTLRQFEGDLALLPSRLDDADWLHERLIAAIEFWDLHLLESHVRKFDPVGVTAFAILEESHAAIHTWPEYGYAHFSMVTCGGKPEVARFRAGLELAFEAFVPRLQEVGYPVQSLARRTKLGVVRTDPAE
jgi:spermidine synthase